MQHFRLNPEGSPHHQEQMPQPEQQKINELLVRNEKTAGNN